MGKGAPLVCINMYIYIFSIKNRQLKTSYFTYTDTSILKMTLEYIQFHID